MESNEEDPEDILFSSLQTLYEYQPITLALAGSVYTYTSKPSHRKPSHRARDDLAPLKISLRTPDTQSVNWSLHASAIWASSLYLADHLDDLGLDNLIGTSQGEKVRVLELGAGAGLPGILITKMYKDVQVTVSDYPDEQLIKTLSENVVHNSVPGTCRIIPYAWGSSGSDLLEGSGFDVIIAADTLWNPEHHLDFIHTLRAVLKKSYSARIYLVAGLHTGRYTIQSFLNAIHVAGFDLQSAVEKEYAGSGERIWDVRYPGSEDEKEKRRWVVWMVLKWHPEFPTHDSKSLYLGDNMQSSVRAFKTQKEGELQFTSGK